MKKIIISIILIITLFLIILFFIDHHKYNLRYNLWKLGLINYNSKFMNNYFLVDSKFRNKLIGKSKKQILKWFNDLRVELKPELYLDKSQPFYISSKNFLWIADTQIAIEFNYNNIVERFSLIKGIPKINDRKKIKNK